MLPRISTGSKVLTHTDGQEQFFFSMAAKVAAAAAGPTNTPGKISTAASFAARRDAGGYAKIGARL